MTNSIEVKPATHEKDHYYLNINGVDLGKWERSQLRHLIEVADNAIV